jgi:hypothetical protein
MSFQLFVFDVETQRTAEVGLSDLDREVLDLQMARCVDSVGFELFAQWLAVALSSALPAVVDYELRPPSDAQVNFAMAIARGLSVALPPKVLKYRGAMHDFLTTHKDAFEARRNTRASVTPNLRQGGSAQRNNES